MARERYLVGVDPEELKPRAPASPPQTPQGKWENFWFYHKWKVIGGAFGLFVVIFLAVQLFQRETYDYHVVVVSRVSMTDAQREQLEKSLAVFGTDLDGDGTVTVNVENLLITDDLTLMQMSQASSAKLSAYLASADRMLFAFDARNFDNLKEGLPEDMIFFRSLEVDSAGIDPEEHYWNWTGSKLADTVQFTRAGDLYFGVRDYTGSDKKAIQTRDDCAQLLKRCIEAQ